jgi:hypothetical protein
VYADPGQQNGGGHGSGEGKDSPRRDQSPRLGPIYLAEGRLDAPLQARRGG